VAESAYLPLGSLETVAAAIQAAFSSAKWNDPVHAHCSLDEYTAILFNLEGVESAKCVLVSVSGGWLGYRWVVQGIGRGETPYHGFH
jgi:hypothetical protein